MKELPRCCDETIRQHIRQGGGQLVFVIRRPMHVYAMPLCLKRKGAGVRQTRLPVRPTLFVTSLNSAMKHQVHVWIGPVAAYGLVCKQDIGWASLAVKLSHVCVWLNVEYVGRGA